MKNALTTADIEKQLLIILHKFLSEMEAERTRLAVTLDASLDHDLGLGSLEKAEIFSRIEKTFEIHLPESLLVEAKTLQDLVIPIQRAEPPHKFLNTEVYASLDEITIDPSTAETLVEVLEKYVLAGPERPHIHLQDDTGKEEIIRYGQLYDQAIMVAKGLLAAGLKVGETVAIMLPTSADFFYAFFGVLLAGGVPVPIYPPFRPDQIEEYAKREAIILRNAEVRVLITFHKAEILSKLLRTFIPSLKEVTTVNALKITEGSLPPIQLSGTDGALIQYTSGSTGNPKGVFLTHANLLANIRAYGKGASIKPTDVIVSWLPLYHDMGLIGTWFGGLYHGAPIVIMSPLNFLNRPERWLWAIHYHGASLSGGPNFAYELCVKKIDEKSIEGLNLSSWRFAFNGAEAVYPKTLESFAKKFAPYGFKAEAIAPVYGLAETAVALTFPSSGTRWQVDKIEREPLETAGKAIPATANSKNFLEVVACGKPLEGHEIRIVDDKERVLPNRRVGNLQFRGPSSMQGYYRNPTATAAVFHEGWWGTGDLGYTVNGELYITGRKKDVIIKAGRNIYPPEIEEIVSQVAGVRKGCVAAFGVKDAKQGTEKFIIVAETKEEKEEQRTQITATIVEKVFALLGIPPDKVILVTPRTIPKTSSGKLRRSATLDAYLKGKLERPDMPAWLQIGKLFLEGQSKNIWRWLGNLGKVFYTFYMWVLLFFTLIPLWLSSFILARSTLQKVTRFWGKLVLRLGALSVKVTGQENLTTQPVIFISNHASYVDTAVLTSILPADVLLIGKSELLKAPIFGTLIKKLGHLTVNRLDFTQSLSDMQLIQAALQEKKSILIFPEGTFTYATGLRPFKMGAFKVAVETSTPICPIALQGTRHVLRSDSFLLRPGVIKVHISAAIAPANKEWSEVIRLRNLARIEIAKYCGEPTLDLIRAGFDEKQD